MSRDGKLAAIGGWTPGAGGMDLLVFDLATQQVVRRIEGLPGITQAMAFSPDGRQLAAGMLGAHGLRRWRLADGAALPGDTEYSDGIYGMDFAADGRLAVGGIDGALRLYNPAGQRTHRVETQPAKKPFRMRFSPDDRLLAAGYLDAPQVEIWNTSTMTLNSRPSVAGVQGGASIPTVAWSADGATLYAGGDTRLNGLRPVYAWGAQGTGPRRVAFPGFPIGLSTLVALTEGRFVLGTGAGDLAVAGPKGQQLAARRAGVGNCAPRAAT